MSEIGIQGLIQKDVNEIEKIVRMFIKSSLNIRQGIVHGDDPGLCMLSLIRDTYMCNLLMRFVGMMTLISIDTLWVALDNKLIGYDKEYYNYPGFKNKLVELYNHYFKIYEDSKKEYDYCKFLNKMINKCDASRKVVEDRKVIRMTENKILNILSITPVIKLPIEKFNKIPNQYETKHGKVIVPLTCSNYYELLDTLDDINVIHQLEKEYMMRSKSSINEFSKLVLLRRDLSRHAGFSTYYKYISRNKYDNSETIKELIIDLNKRLNHRVINEISKIYKFYNRDPKNLHKISICDIIKYNRLHKNRTLFDPKHVINVIFLVLDRFFNIKAEKINEKTWRGNVSVYKLSNKMTSILYGRLFLDIYYDDNKRVSDPISIRISDKMQINTNSRSNAEIVLLANYKDHPSLTYDNIVLLFREFGYVLNGLCYDSRVGLVNYDEEFSNYVPLLMEYFAWDRDVINLIIEGCDQSIADHIEMGRYIDMCFTMKLKCINAKFDHLLHNSEPLLDMLAKSVDGNKVIDEVLETYKNIYKETMAPISTMLIDQVDSIDPNAIIQEINSSQGVLYANLVNEIFAYTSYWIIKEKKNNEFNKCVLSNGVDNYRDLVKNFISKIDTNCFNLYVKNVLKSDILEDYVTEDTNYFDDDESDSESDKDEIIQIQRK